MFQVFRMIGIAMAIAGCVSAAPPAQAMLPQNSIAELRSRFTHETDPVRKAKLFLDAIQHPLLHLGGIPIPATPAAATAAVVVAAISTVAAAIVILREDRAGT